MPFPPTHPALGRALVARNYQDPTPVQEAVLRDDAAERDLLVSAQTGSGKTVAFGLAFADTLLDGRDRFDTAGPPLALVIAPTRELAMQVHGELSWLYADTGAKVLACVGGMDARREQRALAAGCHIVVGTPGRLRDHLQRQQLDPTALRAVVLDEADEMLDLGFREDLEFILETTPETRRTLLFSATIAREIAQLARRYQRDALRLDMVSRTEPHNDIEYRAIRVDPQDVGRAVVNLLRFFESPAALVFCATREAVKTMHAGLQQRGFAAVALSGELSQQDRTAALQALRDGRASVCVATDVAARGLDLPDLGLVIHADLPTNRATLLHRSGRTGRAGRKGVCVLVVPFTKRRRAELLLNAAGVDAAWSGPPVAAEIQARDSERLLQNELLCQTPTEAELTLARILLDGRTPEAIAAALVRLHQARLPAPELFAATSPLRDEPAAARPRRPQGESRQGESRSEARIDPRGQPHGTSRGEPGVWFRISIGRQNNADPKWLVPLICRLGQVSKADIGSIRIFDRDTKFEITAGAAAGFSQALPQAGQHEARIERLQAPPPPPKSSARRMNPAHGRVDRRA